MRNAVFVSYSHSDQQFFRDFEKHLKVLEGVVAPAAEIWSDRRIAAGDLWLDEIHAALLRARVAILLVSPDFLASPFIQRVEVPSLLRAARADGCRIVWVVLRPCLWEETDLGQFQSVSEPDRPLASMERWKRDAVWVEICRIIQMALAATYRPGERSHRWPVEDRREDFSRALSKMHATGQLLLTAEWPLYSAEAGPAPPVEVGWEVALMLQCSPIDGALYWWAVHADWGPVGVLICDVWAIAEPEAVGLAACFAGDYFRALGDVMPERFRAQVVAVRPSESGASYVQFDLRPEVRDSDSRSEG